MWISMFLRSRAYGVVPDLLEQTPELLQNIAVVETLAAKAAE
jgi:hypothetical protein